MFVRTMSCALILILALSERMHASPYRCIPLQTPLREKSREAKFVVIGTLSNPRGNHEQGQTDFLIEQVIKGEEILGKRKALIIPSFISIDPKESNRYVLFGDFAKDKLDIIHTQQVNSPALAAYLKELLPIKEDDRTAVLQCCFKYLDNADSDVAKDAFEEFAKANGKEIAKVAGKLGPNKFRKVLNDPKTSASRLGICARWLGACGTKEDATLLASLANKNIKDIHFDGTSIGYEGILIGYVQIDPKSGWKHVRGLLADEKQEFMGRYAALRTGRFFWDFRPDLISQAEVVDAVQLLLKQTDIADLAIDDLRKWGRWELTDKIVSLYGEKSLDNVLVKRAIIRFALCAPANNAKAVAFLKERRAEEPDRVSQIEQLLEIERKATPKTEPKK